MYSRATTSAMAERWVLPVGFLVDDILEGSVVSRVPQVCNNFEEGELIECCERNRGSGLRTWATTGFSCCGERGRRSVVDAGYNEEALARISLWIFEKVRACAGIHSPKFPHWVSRPLFSDPTLCAPSRVADGCPPADELLSLSVQSGLWEAIGVGTCFAAPLLIRHHHVAQGKVGPRSGSVAANLFHP